MGGSERWTVKCLDTADGSGDVIIELQPDLLTKAGLGLGDELTIKMVDEAVALKPKHRETPSS